MEETVQAIAVEFVKRRKNAKKVEIASVEHRNGFWVVRGTCPIDLEGHPWAEKFELVIDKKGKIKFADFSLL
ncbi:MAG: hypothetical protein RMJ15_04570 [Nitrososphaerota archaeon]|nr:hypothetical protein [Nitrososphaerota archaeon]